MAGIKRRLGSLLGPEGRVPQIKAGRTRQVDSMSPAIVEFTKTGDAEYEMDVQVPSGRDANGDLSTDSTSLRIRDQVGAVAFEVDEHGNTHIGNTQLSESHAPYRVRDQHGSVAFEIDTHGRTHIYDQVIYENPLEVTTLHVFVAAGQSNMSGRGRPVEGPTSPRILQYGANNRTIEPAPLQLDMVDAPSGTSPATFFAHHYLATQPEHVGVLLVPAARGGTVFQGSPENPAEAWTWTKGAAPSPEFALFERSIEQANEALNAAETNGYDVVLKGVMWHQGEGNGSMETEIYAGLLDNLIDDYRDELGHPTLPFMVGAMSPERLAESPHTLSVYRAHEETPSRKAFTGFAPARGGAHNTGDINHFATLGNRYFGDTYMTAYIQALGNTNR